MIFDYGLLCHFILRNDGLVVLVRSLEENKVVYSDTLLWIKKSPVARREGGKERKGTQQGITVKTNLKISFKFVS
jgi:hypothetical protein